MKKYTKVPYLCIYYKLIDRWLKKCMFCNAIISIDLVMTGNIYYKGILLDFFEYVNGVTL